ncbi:MAG: hypothetical protein AAGK02_14550, partial [Pseudomonadota bacterium]
MTQRLGTFLGVAAALTALSACAGSGDRYPSLAIRDAERNTGQFTPALANTNQEAPVISRTDLSAIVSRASSAHDAFLALAPAARNAVESANGLSPENNNWAHAQVVLADLGTQRSETLLALGDLDLLEAKAATTFAPTNDIIEAQSRVRG